MAALSPQLLSTLLGTLYPEDDLSSKSFESLDRAFSDSFSSPKERFSAGLTLVCQLDRGFLPVLFTIHKGCNVGILDLQTTLLEDEAYLSTAQQRLAALYLLASIYPKVPARRSPFYPVILKVRAMARPSPTLHLRALLCVGGPPPPIRDRA
jgi:hypothetical protein